MTKISKYGNLRAKMNQAVDLRNISTEELSKIRSRKFKSSPFMGMKIKNGAFLDEIEGRSLCRLCGKSRKYFCYTCYIPVAELEKEIPRVQIPCQIDIIKHPRETDGKSTAIHATIIAPDHVRIFTYPDIPNYEKETNVFLMFPDKNATLLEDFLVCSTGKPSSISRSQIPSTEDNSLSSIVSRVVFIDCTWNQTKRIHSDERLRGLPCLKLESIETLFWRYQKGKPTTYLATIEAIYHFVKAFHLRFIKDTYEGEYDNLLFFFKYMFEKIHSLYDSNRLLAYKDG